MSLNPFPTQTSRSARQSLDLFGIGIATLCAIHCFATIVIVSGLGVGGHFLLAPEIHEVGLVIAVIVAILAIGWGAVRHRRRGPLLVASAGVATMALGLVVGHGMEEAILTIVGALLVSVGHWFNLRGTG